MNNNDVIKSLNSIEFHLKSAESEFEKIKSVLKVDKPITLKRTKKNTFLEHLVKSGKIIKQ
jgi:3-deoxy-D-arabino-heptulosonate 7-phosphate (DAHP) synthase